jgi:hypothetical protein
MIKGYYAEKHPNLAQLFRCEIKPADHKAWVAHFGPMSEWDDETKENYKEGLNSDREINWLTWYSKRNADYYTNLREEFIKQRLADIEHKNKLIDKQKQRIKDAETALRTLTNELDELKNGPKPEVEYDDWKWSSIYMSH